MVHTLSEEEADQLTLAVAHLERSGLVTPTFRRLDARRQYQILSCVLQEAAETGATDVGVKSVAFRLGISPGALYRYFPDRDTMVKCAAAVAGRFIAAMLDGYAPVLVALPLREGLAAYLGGGMQWSREQQSLLRFFARAAYGGAGDFAESLVAPVSGAMTRLIRAILEAAQQRGETRAGIDLDMTVRLVHALTAVVGDSMLLPFLGVYTRLGSEQQAELAATIDFILAAVGSDEK